MEKSGLEAFNVRTLVGLCTLDGSALSSQSQSHPAVMESEIIRLALNLYRYNGWTQACDSSEFDCQGWIMGPCWDDV